jgi:hypothetical protein
VSEIDALWEGLKLACPNVHSALKKLMPSDLDPALDELNQFIKAQTVQAARDAEKQLLEPACVVCGNQLVPDSNPPHCEDCSVELLEDPSYEEAWREKLFDLGIEWPG